MTWPVMEYAIPDAALVLVGAGILDAILGDPVYPMHPVRLLGKIVRAYEGALRHRRDSGRLGGVALVLLVLATASGGYVAMRCALAALHPWLALVWDGYTLYSCIALKDMVRHAMPIARALSQNQIEPARQAVQMIVGRDTAQLDAAGIARATVESVGESFVDGFFAPLFWFSATIVACRGVAGLPGLPVAVWAVLIYRATNTMDSMVGYKNATYLRFGWAAARWDDGLNLIPARLAIPLLTLAAALCRLDARNGWRIALRDRLKHASPNSAHAESVVAGALGVRLGGPTAYPHAIIEKPWLGDDLVDVTPATIRQVCQLVAVAGALALTLALGTVLICS